MAKKTRVTNTIRTLRFMAGEMTQQQLADLFGVTRPALARVFGEMQREGLIEIDRKTILLKDRKGLNDLLKNG